MTKITDIPAIRFKGFSDTWEQRKFSDLVQIERGGSPRPIDDFITDSPDGLNWVKIGDAPAQGNYITKTAEKIKPEGLSKTREVHPGDLILSNSMSFGKPYIMGIDGCIHDGWLLIRNTYKAFDLTFLCHLLGTPQMIIQYKSLAAGSTVNNLNKELVGNTVVTIPTIKEQRVLGQYLETLDNLITLHQRKYDKLTNVKKSMLEKMFPQNGSNAPEIRFKGFTEPWEQRKLSDCAGFRRGSFPQPYGNKDWYDGEGAMPFVQVADVSDDMKLVDDTKQKISKLAQPRDYINEYLSKARNDQIHRVSSALGLDENLLRNIMSLKLNENNLNEFGRYDELKKTVDKAKAKEYFEKVEGTKIIPPKVNVKVDKLLRDFIISGGYEIQMPTEDE